MPTRNAAHSMTAGTTPPSRRDRLAASTHAILANPRRPALFLDVDGTLLDLAPTPKSVRVPEGLLPLLERLSIAFDGAVALVTGRMIAEIDEILHPLRLIASGVHGSELRTAPDRDIERVARLLPADVVALTHTLASRIPGVIAEPKGSGLAIHYRLAPQAEAEILAALNGALDRHAGAFTLLTGKRLFEIVPSGLSKGTAVAALSALPAFQGRVPIMIGDDVGDEAAFAAVEARSGYAFRVAGEHYPDTVADFAAPRSVLAWLDHVAQRLIAQREAEARF